MFAEGLATGAGEAARGTEIGEGVGAVVRPAGATGAGTGAEETRTGLGAGISTGMDLVRMGESVVMGEETAAAAAAAYRMAGRGVELVVGRGPELEEVMLLVVDGVGWMDELGGEGVVGSPVFKADDMGCLEKFGEGIGGTAGRSALEGRTDANKKTWKTYDLPAWSLVLTLGETNGRVRVG